MTFRKSTRRPASKWPLERFALAINGGTADGRARKRRAPWRKMGRLHSLASPALGTDPRHYREDLFVLDGSCGLGHD
ncbi:MAG TPA: hypothetical protein VN742_04820 [Candidatus Binataceae bacterium]|nr:hypothetical protein [Candidatus Binataceae bacterium]